SLALVTDQYLQYIHSLEEMHADDISAFLVMAARLLQIKSEALLPRPPVRAAGEEDLAQSLVDQLRLYKRFKETALWLDMRQEAGLRTYLRVAAPPKIEPKLDLTNVTLEALQRAALTAFSKAQRKEPLDSVIAAPKITIREKISLIGRTLKQLSRASFRALLGRKPSRLEVVVTFLALLELIKRYRVEVFQEALFGDIEVQRLEDWGDEEEIDLEFE
ncbi:MAG TPA: segregation/condensation protein A, partial [Anaerolineales bacterium]|nr:segregation/condensation protein A [Anaerolineales bacterium]